MADTSRNPGGAQNKGDQGGVVQQAKEAAANLGQKAQDVASAATQRASEVASNLGQRAQDVAATAGERAEETISAVGQRMSSLAGTIRQNVPGEGRLGTAAGALAGGLEAGGQYLQEHNLSDMVDDLSGLVRQHPVPSLLIVFGVGFLMGSALRR